MSTPVDREGTFRAEIVEYGFSEMESGSKCVNLKVKLLEFYNKAEDEWQPWAEYDMEADGSVWVVNKKGETLENAVKSLATFAGWDGDIESLVNNSWQPTKCAVVIQPNTYNNETKLKISFVNDWNRKPGATGNATPESAKAAQARYGAQFRAIAGNAKRNGSAPPSKGPPSPPPAPPPAPDKRTTESSIPF